MVKNNKVRVQEILLNTKLNFTRNIKPCYGFEIYLELRDFGSDLSLPQIVKTWQVTVLVLLTAAGASPL